MTLLIVSAWLPEQSELRKWVAEAARGELKPAAIDFLTCGIGPIHSACAVTEQLNIKQYQHVLFCGTAGAYSRQTDLLSVYTSHSSFFTDAGAMTNLSYFPATDLPYQHIESLPPGGECGYREVNADCVDCVTLPSITKCDKLSEKLALIGTLENMELFGVARAASKQSITWSAVLGVANWTGPGASAQWQMSHLAASVKAQRRAWHGIEAH